MRPDKVSRVAPPSIAMTIICKNAREGGPAGIVRTRSEGILSQSPEKSKVRPLLLSLDTLPPGRALQSQ